MAGRVEGLDNDGAEGETGVVGGGCGDGVGVFAAYYGELLVGVFCKLEPESVYTVERWEGESVRSCGFPRRGRGGWTLVLEWCELAEVMVGTYWWVLMIAVRLISPDFTRGLKVGITL